METSVISSSVEELRPEDIIEKYKIFCKEKDEYNKKAVLSNFNFFVLKINEKLIEYNGKISMRPLVNEGLQGDFAAKITDHYTKLGWHVITKHTYTVDFEILIMNEEHYQKREKMWDKIKFVACCTGIAVLVVLLMNLK